MDHETRGFFEHFAPKGADCHLNAVIYKHSAPPELQVNASVFWQRLCRAVVLCAISVSLWLIFLNNFTTEAQRFHRVGQIIDRKITRLTPSLFSSELAPRLIIDRCQLRV